MHFFSSLSPRKAVATLCYHHRFLALLCGAFHLSTTRALSAVLQQMPLCQWRSNTLMKQFHACFMQLGLVVHPSFLLELLARFILQTAILCQPRYQVQADALPTTHMSSSGYLQADIAGHRQAAHIAVGLYVAVSCHRGNPKYVRITEY